jgi:HAE1 family hydrophobic/amphiphilic exporter-1
VRNAAGQPVPLSTLVRMREVNGPEFTTRFNEYRAAQINGLLAPGFSTRQGMQALEEVFAQTMSRDMGFDYSGMSFQEQVASQGVPASAVIGFSVLVVFLLMAALYESWTLPFAVLLATPIAMFGALGALCLRRFALAVFSQIGPPAVIGLRRTRSSPSSSPCRLRGRNVARRRRARRRPRRRAFFMTSFAFILGCVVAGLASGSARWTSGLGTVASA